MRGTSHHKSGLRLQDAIRCFSAADGDYLVAVICDGAGSASHGGEGASLSARVISNRSLDYVRDQRGLPSDEEVGDWIHELRDLISVTAKKRGLIPRDFATTLVAAIVGPTEALMLHVGDGAIVGRMKETEDWTSFSWPEHGEYVSTTFFLTDNEDVKLRTSRLEGVVNDIVLFSDGLERLALDFQAHKPHAPFLQTFSNAVRNGEAGRQNSLSRELGKYLDSSSINERTDDDKSLIVATRP